MAKRKLKLTARQMLEQFAKDSNGVLEYGPMAEKVIVKAMQKFAEQESAFWIKTTGDWEKAYAELVRIIDGN